MCVRATSQARNNVVVSHSPNHHVRCVRNIAGLGVWTVACQLVGWWWCCTRIRNRPIGLSSTPMTNLIYLHLPSDIRHTHQHTNMTNEYCCCNASSGTMRSLSESRLDLLTFCCAVRSNVHRHACYRPFARVNCDVNSGGFETIFG
jgi:hypothetical protein